MKMCCWTSHVAMSRAFNFCHRIWQVGSSQISSGTEHREACVGSYEERDVEFETKASDLLSPNCQVNHMFCKVPCFTVLGSFASFEM